MAKTPLLAALAGAVGLAVMAFGSSPGLAAPVSSGTSTSLPAGEAESGLILPARHIYGRPHHVRPYVYRGPYYGPRRFYGPPRAYGPPRHYGRRYYGPPRGYYGRPYYR